MIDDSWTNFVCERKHTSKHELKRRLIFYVILMETNVTLSGIQLTEKCMLMTSLICNAALDFIQFYSAILFCFGVRNIFIFVQ